MAQMEKVTQSNAAGAEQTAGAVEQLNARAKEVQQSVLLLQRLAGLELRKEIAAPSPDPHVINPRSSARQNPVTAGKSVAQVR